MQPLYDYKKFAVLYVDDEEKSLKGFSRAFADDFRIYTAPSAVEGLRLLEAHRDEIGVLISDQRMPGEKGVWLLEKARQLRPGIIRMLATAYADMEAAIAAVNSGAIYRYIIKPWDPPELAATLKRGLEFFMVQRERDQLLHEKMSVLHNMMIADRIVSLGLLAAGLSHHIRNSLVAVKTFLDLAPGKMQEEKVDYATLRHPDFWKEYYQNVQAQIERINNMLKDLWIAAEPANITFHDTVQLYQVVTEVTAELKTSLAEKALRVINEIPEELPSLIVDKLKFHRLFQLLLKDELASLPPGSEVRFSARMSPETEAGKTPMVEVQMRDNGPGLPAEALRLIFDPFAVRSGNPLEYGINLMACYFIVHHHSGKIEARSDGGQGTVFTLRLVTDANQPLQPHGDTEFLQKVMLNDTLWEKLLTSA